MLKTDLAPFWSLFSSFCHKYSETYGRSHAHGRHCIPISLFAMYQELNDFNFFMRIQSTFFLLKSNIIKYNTNLNWKKLYGALKALRPAMIPGKCATTFLPIGNPIMLVAPANLSSLEHSVRELFDGGFVCSEHHLSAVARNSKKCNGLS